MFPALLDYQDALLLMVIQGIVALPPTASFPPSLLVILFHLDFSLSQSNCYLERCVPPGNHMPPLGRVKCVKRRHPSDSGMVSWGRGALG